MKILNRINSYKRTIIKLFMNKNNKKIKMKFLSIFIIKLLNKHLICMLDNLHLMYLVKKLAKKVQKIISKKFNLIHIKMKPKYYH